MFHEPLRPFSRTYRCFSVSMLPGQERQDVDNGGKSRENNNIRLQSVGVIQMCYEWLIT